MHIIQLPDDDIEHEEQLMDAYHQQSQTLRRHSQRSQRHSVIDERMIETTYPVDARINPAYTHHDEEYIINGKFDINRLIK